MSQDANATCKHENFHANVSIARLAIDEAGDKIVGFSADITIKCRDCNLPFEFIGLPMGYTPFQPACSVDSLEARMPIKPKGESVSHEGLAGFTIRRIE